MWLLTVNTALCQAVWFFNVSFWPRMKKPISATSDQNRQDRHTGFQWTLEGRWAQNVHVCPEVNNRRTDTGMMGICSPVYSKPPYRRQGYQLVAIKRLSHKCKYRVIPSVWTYGVEEREIGQSLGAMTGQHKEKMSRLKWEKPCPPATSKVSGAAHHRKKPRVDYAQQELLFVRLIILERSKNERKLVPSIRTVFSFRFFKTIDNPDGHQLPVPLRQIQKPCTWSKAFNLTWYRY